MNKNSVLISIIICLLYCGIVKAQINDISADRNIKAIPFQLKVINDPLELEFEHDSIIKITSKEKTNLFNSPGNNFYRQNAPMLLFHPNSNFVFTAKVRADLREVYDVAALVIYENKDLWAKLCYENSINKEPTVVSVVTRKLSDDCNSVKIEGGFVYLAMVKKGDEFSFHYSVDNRNWELVRHFNLECDSTNLMIGFAVHCSRGDKFSAEFSDISYSNQLLENMRKF